ncbi:putative ATP-grasp-modified RiPP [Streptomyces sp. NPDC059578]|uniref:putative ATP-grasp-modified RiPP n=1 Tax=unclassified Streptomyces TaxID=2593676 RepID=UPI003659B4D2
MTRQTVAPWGLTRMEPYPTLSKQTATLVGLDPDTQTAIYQDAEGRRVDMGKHSTHHGVETATTTNPGDGASPGAYDEDHDQRTEQDESES